MFLDENGNLLCPLPGNINPNVPSDVLLVYPFITLDRLDNSIVVCQNANFTYPIVYVTPQEVKIVQHDHNLGVKIIYFPFEQFHYGTPICDYSCKIYYDDKVLHIWYSVMQERFQYDQSFADLRDGNQITYWDNELLGQQLHFAVPDGTILVNKMLNPTNIYAYNPSEYKIYRYGIQDDKLVLMKVVKNAELLLIAPDNSILYQSTKSGNYYIFCYHTNCYGTYKVAKPLLRELPTKSARNI